MKKKKKITKVLTTLGVVVTGFSITSCGETVITNTSDNNTSVESPTTTEESSTSVVSTTEESVTSETIESTSETTTTVEEEKVKFEFETNGGSVYQTISLNAGDKVEKPTDPTKESKVEKGMEISYSFAGWYSDPNFENEFSFDTEILTDTKIYAKWEENKKIAEGYKEVKTSMNVSSYASKVGQLSEDLISGMFSIESGTTIRTRSRGWEQKEYKDYPYLNQYPMNDGSTSIADLSSFTHSVKITDKKGIKVITPGYGYVSFYIQNGSSGASEQSVIVTDSKGNKKTYVFPGTNFSSPVVQLSIECEAGETYTLTRPSGTVDVFAAECVCVAQKSNESGIQIANPGKVDYLVNTELDLSDLSISLNYENGTFDALDVSKCSIDTSAVDLSTPGTYTIKVTYDKFETSFDVKVHGIEKIELGVNGIEQVNNSQAGNGVYFNKTIQYIYKVGDTVSFENLTVLAYSANGELFRYNYDAKEVSYSTVDTRTPGKKTVTVTLTLGNEIVSKEIDIYVVDSELTTTLENQKTVVNVCVDSNYMGEIGYANDLEISTGKTIKANTFKTIEQALEFLSLQDGISANRKNVYIKAGYYKEKLEITIPYVSLIGLGDATNSNDISKAVVIEYDSLYGEIDERGFTHTTDSTQTVSVRDSAIGCVIDNIVISNYWNSLARFNERKDATTCDHRALALLVQADQFTLKNSQLLGYQDTVEFFQGRQYVIDSFISGTTDFIFGTNNTTYFNNCEIRSISNGSTSQGGYITAFKGCNKGASDYVKYGAIFDNCNFTADEGVPDGLTAIGRCWASYAAVATINSTIGKHVSLKESSDSTKNERYVAMNAKPTEETIQFVEYNNKGEGAITKAQAGVKYLTEEEAKNYSDLKIVFGTQNGAVTFTDVWDPLKADIVEDDKSYYLFDGTSNPTGEVYNYDLNVNSQTETKTATLGALTFDATNGGKIQYREANGDTQCNAKATITFNVEKGTNVLISTYSSTYNYEIKGSVDNVGYTAGSSTSAFYFSEAQAVTITFKDTVYLHSIIINPNEEKVDNELKGIKLSGFATTLSLGTEFDYGSLSVKGIYSNLSYTDIDLSLVTIDSSNVDMSKPGVYVVSVKYLDFTELYEVCVEEENKAFTMDTMITFGSNGNYTNVSKMDKSTAQIRDNGGDNSQFSKGDLSFYVLAGSKVEISSYSGYTSYKLTDGKTDSGEITDTSYVYVAQEDTLVKISAVNSNNYFYSIKVTVPNAIRESAKISFGSNGNYKDYIDISTANFRDNGGDNSQIYGKFELSILDGATVTINGFSGYTNYTILNPNGSSSGEITDATYSFETHGFGTYIIEGLNNNYFYSIDVTYINVIKENAKVTFGSNGNYKDYVDVSKANIRDNGGDNTQVQGPISFNVKEGAVIVINGYPGYTSYTIGDGSTTSEVISDTTYTFKASKDGKFELNGSSNNYFISIEITYPNVIKTNTSITFGSEGNYKDYVEVASANIRDNGGNNTQIAGPISFNVKEGATITIHGYPGYTGYSVSDGSNVSDEINTEEYIITVTSDSTYVINGTNNNYLISIDVTF